jgi:hypothetical protein
VFFSKIIDDIKAPSTIRAGKVGDGQSGMRYDAAQSLYSGGHVSNQRTLGTVGVTVFEGQAAADAIELSRTPVIHTPPRF